MDLEVHIIYLREGTLREVSHLLLNLEEKVSTD